MSPAALPLAPRAEVSFSFLETAREASLVCRVWLWSEAGSDSESSCPRSLLLESERLSPEARVWKVERVRDLAGVPLRPPVPAQLTAIALGALAQSHESAEEELCLIWKAGEAESLRTLAAFRAKSSLPIVVVLRCANETGKRAAKRRLLEAGASDCLLEEELSAPLLEHCLRGALRNARAQDNARALESARHDLEEAQRLTHLGWWWVTLDGIEDFRDAPGYACEEFYRIVGFAPDEVPTNLGEWQKQFVPEDWARAMELIASLSAPDGPASVSLEHRLFMPDGSQKWVESRAELERDASGVPVRLVGTVLDVSERVLIARRALESERRMHAAVDNSPLVLWQLDPHGVITLARGAALRSMGIKPFDIEGQSIFDTTRGVEAIEQLARRALGGEECEGSGWFGGRFMAVRYAPLPEGGALGVGIDQSETEQVREQWRESERRYASIVANVPGVVYRFVREANGAMRFDFISARAREIWGEEFDWRAGNLAPHLERIHPDDLLGLHTSIEESAHHLSAWDWSGRLLDTDGNWKWVRGASIPWRRDDGATVWDGLVVDETAMRSSQAEVARSRRAFDEAQKLARVGSFDWNIKTGSVEWSTTTFTLFGYEPHSFTPQIETIRDHIHPDDRDLVVSSTERALHTGSDSMLFRIRRVDGQERYLQAYAQVELDADGAPIRYLGSTQDVTEQIWAERALRDSEERYALAARGANDGLWDWNLRTGTIYLSPRWLDMIGCRAPATDHPNEWLQRVHPDDHAELHAKLDAHLRGHSAHFECEYRLKHRDGQWMWMLGRGLAVRDQSGEATRISGSQTDICARKNFEAQLAQSAFYDALTGLPNRALFLDRLERAIARQEHSFAVLFLDLDRFKNINDSLGHLAGDRLLVEAGERFASCLRPGDTVARLGGDEFAVLLEELADEAVIEAVASRIGRELERPFLLEGREVFVTVSMGVAPSQGGPTSAPELLRNADTAMYRAKGLGRARHAIFDASMHQSAVRLLELESDLWRALERCELRVFFQPIVSLDTGRVSAAEALVRWQHPTRGLVSPAEFIPLAEETGLIVPIGWWVLEEACRQGAAWGEDLTIAVNLSSQQFSQGDLLERVADILVRTGFAATRLKLEITESVIMGNAESASQMLRGLRKMGIELAMDDFGTGYSSLSYLHRFPLDVLKIDRSFVAQMGGDARNSQIVGTILSLARGLQMHVVAEGVESKEQLDALRALGCDAAQGFYFARPLPPDEFTALLHQNPCW